MSFLKQPSARVLTLAAVTVESGRADAAVGVLQVEAVQTVRAARVRSALVNVSCQTSRDA